MRVVVVVGFRGKHQGRRQREGRGDPRLRSTPPLAGVCEWISRALSESWRIFDL